MASFEWALAELRERRPVRRKVWLFDPQLALCVVRDEILVSHGRGNPPPPLRIDDCVFADDWASALPEFHLGFALDAMLDRCDVSRVSWIEGNSPFRLRNVDGVILAVSVGGSSKPWEPSAEDLYATDYVILGRYREAP